MDWDWFGDTKLTKGQLTQLKIIDGALHLLSRNGIQSVTLQQIAKYTKTSHPLILKHFTNKETLLQAVRKYVTFQNHKWVDSKIKNEMNGREKLMTFLYENFVWANKYPEQAKIILLTYYYSSLDHSKYSPGQAAFELGVKRTYQHCLQVERENEINFSGNIQLLSEIIHEYAIGLFIKMIATEKPKTKAPRAIYKKKLTQFLDQFILPPSV